MKKETNYLKRKIIAFTLALTMFLSIGSPASVTAASENANNQKTTNQHAPLPALDNVKKFDRNAPNETVINEKSNKLPQLLNVQNKKTLESYGVNSNNNAVSVKDLKDNKNVRNITEADFGNKCIVGFDDNGEIVSISNLNNPNTTKVFSTLEEAINTIETNSKIKDGYKLITSEAMDDDYWLLTWQKDIGDGTLNPNDSLKVILNKNTNSIVTLNKVKMTSNINKPVISKDEALKSAQPVLSAIPQVKNTTVTQGVVRANYYWNDGGPYQKEDTAKLAYIINVNNDELYIYIDAVTGKNLGGDMSRKDGKAFGYMNLYGAYESSQLASNAMAWLGYNSDSFCGGGDYLGTSIQEFWNGSSSYGFYVACHGSSSSLFDGEYWTLFPSNVTGNWNFVFLDACNTGLNTTWAKAFKIYGYSGRAFLGWYNSVQDNASFNFNINFWPELVYQRHSSSVRDAAIWAAGQVAEYTPIRFYGDRYYNGRV